MKQVYYSILDVDECKRRFVSQPNEIRLEHLGCKWILRKDLVERELRISTRCTKLQLVGIYKHSYRNLTCRLFADEFYKTKVEIAFKVRSKDILVSIGIGIFFMLPVLKNLLVNRFFRGSQAIILGGFWGICIIVLVLVLYLRRTNELEMKRFIIQLFECEEIT